MRQDSVPRIDRRYWVAISLASIFGCNLGDFVSHYLRLGNWLGLIPLAAVFAALSLGERRSLHPSPVWYWAIVIVLRTAATNLADLATQTWGLPYAWVLPGLTVLELVMVIPVRARLPDGHPDGGGRPSVDAWYWMSLLTAGTLGTAIGDWVAEDLHLGTGIGTLLLGSLFAIVLAAGRRSRWSTKAGYWLAIVAVRSAGTTAGDWLAFRHDAGLINGLHLGLPISTTCTGIVFLATLLLWRAPLTPARTNNPPTPPTSAVRT